MYEEIRQTLLIVTRKGYPYYEYKIQGKIANHTALFGGGAIRAAGRWRAGMWNYWKYHLPDSYQPSHEKKRIHPYISKPFISQKTDKLLAVFCLGPLRIFYAQKPLVLQSKKAEELLAYLVCEKGNLISKK